MELVSDMYENGDLEKIACTIGGIAVAGYMIWMYYTYSAEGRGDSSDSESDSDDGTAIIGGRDMTDSDEEPDAKA
eukprot:8962023-Pyramimonas_sp.AAC.1